MTKKGFVKFESLTILFVIILLFAIGLYIILGMANKQKYDTMNKSALNFVDSTSRAENAFNNYRTYYLVQAADEGILTRIKSPFSKGDCDENESKVVFDSSSNTYYVTLKCGDYLMKDRKSTDSGYTIYKVGKWSDTKTNDNDDSREVYSCNGCGVDGEYEEVVFTHLYNKANGTSHIYITEIKDLTKKTQYRTMEKVFEK